MISNTTNTIHTNHRAFTLIEMLISMALITIAISIFIQTSGMFNDRLNIILQKNKTKTDLMRLAIYLDDLYGIADMVAIENIDPNANIDSNEIIFYKINEEVSRCRSDYGDIICIFYSSISGKEIPIFSLTNHGFSQIEWGTTTQNQITQHFVILTNPNTESALNSKSTKTKVNFGLFPGVNFLYQ